MGAVKIFFGIFFFILLLTIIGLFGFLIYVYNNPTTDADTQPLTGGECKNVIGGGSECYQLGDYNVYPTSVIDAESETIAFPATAVYQESDMTGATCMQQCDNVDGCNVAVCTTFGDGNKCTCVGYKEKPTTINPDTSSVCSNDNRCSTVYVKN